MMFYKPDYAYYAKMDGLTLEEFCLLLHEIDPKFCGSTPTLEMVITAGEETSGLISPNNQPYFKATIEKVRYDYNLLKRVPWSSNYENCYNMANGTILTTALITEALKKGMVVPTEFMERYNGIHNKQSNKSENIEKTRLSAKEKTTLLNLVGALVTLYWDERYKDKELPKINQSTIISKVIERFPKAQGLSQRNMEKYLPEALRQIGEFIKNV